MTPTNLDSLISDLVTLDPSLRGREAELRTLAEKLLAARPDAQPDEKFLRELRAELIREVRLLSGGTAKVTKSFIHSSLSPMSPTLRNTLAGLALLLVIALPALSPLGLQLPGLPAKSGVEVTPAADGAVETLDMAASSKMMAEGRGMGGGGYGGFAPGVTSEIDFAYAGELPALPEAQTALRRETKSTEFAETILGNLDLPFVSKGAFQNLRVDSLSLAEDQPYGLSVTYSSSDGSVNVYKNWNKWPNPMEACREQGCYDRLKLKESDVPSDAEMIRIAGEFLGRLGVETADYAAPEVDTSWRTSQVGTSELWIPDEISVVYPLRMEGGEVREQYGGKAGIRVNVDIRQKRASSAGPFQPQKFTEVKYAGIGASELRDQLRSGGGTPQPLPIGEESTRPAARLGEPTRILVHVSYWSEARKESQDLLIPALSFPVTEIPDGYEVAKSATEKPTVVVPLVRGFQMSQNVPIYRKGEDGTPPIQTMAPMMKAASGVATPETAGNAASAGVSKAAPAEMKAEAVPAEAPTNAIRTLKAASASPAPAEKN